MSKYIRWILSRSHSLIFGVSAYFVISFAVFLLISCRYTNPPSLGEHELDKTSLSTSTTALAPVAEDSDHSFLDDFQWDDRTFYRNGLIDEAQYILDEIPGASVYQIDFQISSDRLELAGTEVVHYTNREAVELVDIVFMLYPNASGGDSSVANIRIDHTVVKPVYQNERTSIRVPLKEKLLPGETIRIELDFSVKLPIEMAGNYGLFGYFDEIIVLDEFYPVIPVFDSDGWHDRIPGNGDVTFLDASFYLVRVSASPELVIVSSGIEIDRQQGEQVQIVTIASGPARDYYLVASEKFIQLQAVSEKTKINSYAFPENREAAQRVLDTAVFALEAFNARFGDYPYTDMDLVSTPMQALGIEYPGIMGLSLDAYDLDAEVAGLPASIILEGSAAHEVGHQWFYNVVGNDQVNQPWLDEAVVQYITGLYYLDRYGSMDGFRESWYSRWERISRAEIPIGLPSDMYESSEYSPIIYGRGPIFLDQLVQSMGENVFEDFLRSYYKAHLWGIGTTEEFEAQAERICKCDLSDLFSYWVYGE